MWRMAVIFRPLRSKRATISPVRPRAKASGLTRMSVLSMGGPFGRRRRGAGQLRGGRRIMRDRRLVRRSGPAAAARGGRRTGAGLRLAVGAQLPGGVDRLPAGEARVLELAHAA